MMNIKLIINDGWNPEWSLNYHPFQKNLTDQRFGRLVAIQPAARRTSGRTAWDCICDCGTFKSVDSRSMIRGTTLSCGCYRNDRNGKRLEKGEASFNSLYSSYKISAERRNLEFSLNKEQFRNLTSQSCYLCGQKPERVSRRPQNTGDYVYNGIDRIDNNIGYNLSNCKPCCTTCNLRKYTSSLKELLQWVEKVYIYNELGK